jgi:murein DD-endopeptidase MepM/ murein hydrolase activator NlpD
MPLLTLLLTSLSLASSLLLADPSTAQTTPAPARQGVWPLQPRPEVAAGFDAPATPWGAGHRGVDLVGHVGQRVYTSLAGTVTFAAPLAGRGVVVVDHGGVRTTYEPVRASVSIGEAVGRGAVIGTLQRAASHCFPRACLHWGLVRGSSYLDPLTLVGAGPIRLLPLTGDVPVPLSPSAPHTDSPSSMSRGPDRAV